MNCVHRVALGFAEGQTMFQAIGFPMYDVRDPSARQLSTAFTTYSQHDQRTLEHPQSPALRYHPVTIIISTGSRRPEGRSMLYFATDFAAQLPCL